MLAPHEPTLAAVFAPRTTIAPDGTVEGYASLFGEIDQARDMVMAGAFRETLRLRGVRRIPMLFQHDPAEPIGIWQELIEDSRGLFARGRLIPEVQRGREVLALVKSGAIDGLSIGFKTVRGRMDPRTRIRRIEQLDLWEISIVTFPLLTGARVRAVKDAQAPCVRRQEVATATNGCSGVIPHFRFRARRRSRRGRRSGGARLRMNVRAMRRPPPHRLCRPHRASTSYAHAAKRRRRDMIAVSAAGSPSRHCARWPTARH